MTPKILVWFLRALNFIKASYKNLNYSVRAEGSNTMAYQSNKTLLKKKKLSHIIATYFG